MNAEDEKRSTAAAPAMRQPAAAVPPPPHEARQRKSQWLLKIAIEAALVSLGVFLALLGDQWRDNSQIRELRDASLRRFRTEIQANRKGVSAVKDYHVAVLKSLERYAAADPKTRSSDSVQIRGLQPVFFEHTEWDLALATQSLAHIDSDLAFGLSRIYGAQQSYADFTRGIMQAVYLRPIRGLFEALRYYYADVTMMESALTKMYDEILPRIERALAE